MVIWGRGHNHICAVTPTLLSRWILNTLNWKWLRVQQWDYSPARFGRWKREYRHSFFFLWQHWKLDMWVSHMCPYNILFISSSCLPGRSFEVTSHVSCWFLILGGSSDPLRSSSEPPWFSLFQPFHDLVTTLICVWNLFMFKIPIAVLFSWLNPADIAWL